MTAQWALPCGVVCSLATTFLHFVPTFSFFCIVLFLSVSLQSLVSRLNFSVFFVDPKFSAKLNSSELSNAVGRIEGRSTFLEDVTLVISTLRIFRFVLHICSLFLGIISVTYIANTGDRRPSVVLWTNVAWCVKDNMLG